MKPTFLHDPSAADLSAGATALPLRLEELARTYRGALVRFFAKRLHNAADAEDLAQEVFVRMARQGGPQSITHVEAYLFQAASNLLRDRARREQTHRAGEHIPLEDSGYEGEAPSEERVYEGKQTLDGFLSVLARMPLRRRTVFVMHRFMGLSYGAIAVQLGISVGVVEKHMMKALLQFHCQMEQP